MEKQHYEKYFMTESAEKGLFENALIVFDSSALLDFYYYSEETRNEIFNNLFEKLKHRLWIPNQVEFEFLKNRTKVINKPKQSYVDLLHPNKTQNDSGYISKMETYINELKTNQLRSINGIFQTLEETTKSKDKHPFLNPQNFQDFRKKIVLLEKYIDGFEKNFELFKDQIKKEIDSKIIKITNSMQKDSVLTNLQKYLSVGKEFTYDQILDIIKEGELRYKNQIPPGYEDESEKIGFQVYGDLILWKQVIDKSIEESKSIIFITNDNKEDWWLFDGKNKTKQPRFELIKEINDKADVLFWMYSSTDFLYKANSLLKAKIEPTTIEEVSKVVKARKIYVNEDMFRSWIVSSFKNLTDIAFFNNYDKGVDYVITDENKLKTGIAIYKSKGTKYTSTFLPIKDILMIKDQLKNNNSIANLIFLLMAEKQSSAEALVKHVTRKNPYNLLKQHKNDFKLIIGFSDDEEFIPIFNSGNLIFETDVP